MTDARWRQVKSLFEAAIERPPSDRLAFVAGAAGEDDALRREVESLLSSDHPDVDFTDRLPFRDRSPLAEALAEARQLNDPAQTGTLPDGSVTVGPYEVVALLGAGGMGEVFRARDSKLNRDVALKVLPSAVEFDPDRLARLRREAQILAALNHPHIAAIYGLEESNGRQALVLELVEGVTLANRIADGPLALVEALTIARQLAEALQAAHEKGIIHRDLKPANIKVTPAGMVKVLDFGLAKTAAAEPSQTGPSQSPNVAGNTHVGVILGTAAYMSPEQARGLPVDTRSDVWAFGCVLYEMLAGQKAFDGKTMAETTSAILEREPDYGALPSATSASVRRLLTRCLEKDVNRRLGDIGDARVELVDAIGTIHTRSLLARARAVAHSGGWLTLAGAATALIAVVAAVAMLWRSWGPWPGGREPLHATFSQISSQSGLEWFPSLSPDGQWIAYGGDGNGNRDIYLQSATSQTAINLTADSLEDDDQPAFSPDGERIAFRSSRGGGGVFVMSRSGESVRRVTREGFKPTWSPDGSELAVTSENADLDPQNTLGLSALWVVNVASGVRRQVGNVDAVLPSWSPHGHRIAYTTRGAKSGSTRLDIWTVDRSGADPVAVTADGALNWNPVWSPDGGHLYFVSGRGGPVNLWRVAIDERSGRTSGRPEPVTTPASFVTHITISADGSRIAYSSILRSRNIQQLTLDPVSGAPSSDPVWVTTGSRLWANPDPSPDGQQIVFYSSLQPEGDLYIARTDGMGLRQLTDSPTAIDRMPRWSPDGRWIAFHSIRGKDQHLWKVRADGSELQQLSPLADAIYPAWSPDGSRIAVLMGAGLGHPDNNVYIFDPNLPWEEQEPEIVSPPPDGLDEFVVNSWSPDGERLVGQAGLAARGIMTYSLRSRTFERLTDFGGYPVWLPDSRRVLFVSGGKHFFVLDTQSRKVDRVFSIQRDVIGPPQVTRDGTRAYFTRRVTEGDIWLLTLDGASR